MADRKNDEYKNVKFYAENTTAKKSGFSKFKTEKDFYFCRYIDGDIAMLSQAYSSEAGRDNGIESVKKNEKLVKRYAFEKRGSKHGFALKAGNGHEIAISPDYASLAAAEHVSGRLTGKAKAKKASPKPAKAKVTSPKKAAAKPKVKKTKAPKATAAATAFTASDKRIENYRPLSFYKTNGGKADGFNSFEKNGAYYFHYNEDGKIVLISESYTSRAGRDNGIASVTKNMKLKTAYQHHKHKNGKHYFDINAANKQEIATSRWYSSEAKALQGAANLRGEKAKSRSANVEQNYMPLAFYKKHTSGKQDGIETFEGSDGEHYFVYRESGKIALISEGYPTQAARDVGVASVEKNIKLEKRYVQGTGADGKPGFGLRAGNNKEIARSVPYATAAAAAAGAAILYAGRKARSGNVEQNYQPLAFYKKATEGKEDGFETFKGEDGEHYFAYFENGKIALISEGYPAAAVRDKGMASVEKNMKLENRYVYGKGTDGKDGFILRAGNNKEIARSVGYGSAAAAAAGAAYLLGTRKRAVGAAAPKSAAPITTAVAGTAALAGAAAMAATPKAEPVAAAPIEAAAVAPVTTAPAAAAAAAPAAASAGGGAGIWGWLKWLLMGLIALLAAMFLFKACAGGDKDVKAPAAATTTETGAPAVMVTCWNDTKAKTEANCPVKITCWDESFATSQAACPVQPAPLLKSNQCWDGSEASDDGSCPPEPDSMTTATTSSNANSNVGVAGANAANATNAANAENATNATNANSSLGVAGANTANAANTERSTDANTTSSRTTAGTTVTAAAPKVSVGNTTSGRTTAKMTAPSIAGRICGPSANVLFDVGGMTPKNVTYLGSNPQFGNSLTYTPDEFFRRLQVKYRTSPRDKSFLDLMARSLGYGAFADMDASMFSDDTLANGTSGLLGFGAQHALQYSTLNVTDPTHLEAFKVRSANGTDVHFMKRCGNYMYVCQP